MKTDEVKNIRDSIVEAIKISAARFLKKKKESGQKIIVSESGVIKIVYPEDMK